MSETFAEGATCRPNFSAAGRRRRRTASMISAVIAVGLLAVLIGLDVSWPFRLLVGLPAGGAFISGLQVTRNTCVAHAATGSFENEDMSLTKADAAFAEASKKVARTIWRDGALGALAVALLAAATVLV
jgi:hypothetical protein